MKKFGSTDLDQELRDVQAYIRSENPSRLATADHLYSLATRLAEEEPGTSVEDAEKDDPEETAIDLLNKDFTPIGKKGRKWWLGPQKNLMVNQTFMGTLNLWVFTILSMQGVKRAYKPAGPRNPEGIVIDPAWVPFKKDSYDATPKIVDIFKRLGGGHNSIKGTASHQLNMIETEHKIKIPSAVRSKIEGSMEKVAKRRVEIDRLRTKKELWPFDGGKPIKLSNW